MRPPHSGLRLLCARLQGSFVLFRASPRRHLVLQFFLEFYSLIALSVGAPPPGSIPPCFLLNTDPFLSPVLLAVSLHAPSARRLKRRLPGPRCPPLSGGWLEASTRRPVDNIDSPDPAPKTRIFDSDPLLSCPLSSLDFPNIHFEDPCSLILFSASYFPLYYDSGIIYRRIEDYPFFFYGSPSHDNTQSPIGTGKMHRNPSFRSPRRPFGSMRPFCDELPYAGQVQAPSPTLAVSDVS